MATTDKIAPTETPKYVDTLKQLPRDGYELYVRDFPAEDGKHEYRKVNAKRKAGIMWPGCSTIGKAFPDRPDPLMFWAERMTLEGVARLSAAQVSIPDDPHILRNLMKEHELRWMQLRDKAAVRGRNVHREMLEALATGERVPDLAELPEEQRGYGQAVFRWWAARKPIPSHVEQVVLSLEHGYAGRSDLICELTGGDLGPFRPGRGIIDLKTGNGIRQRDGTIAMPRSDHVQIQGYRIAAIECGLIEDVDWLMLLQVGPDGTYREHIASATSEDFHLALDSYNAAKRLDRDMVSLP